ncbi:MAG: 3-isopropylmalate dehydrogenase [Candidatus Jacksonbacteria bacterium RIFOXYA2_FULL_44_7]|uniref:3-isopropylmalate dehydrogenase n=1 Tax=Candidatus Jacksonbacteria bacterium RIFCSPLOWO2_02_FULL_44_20 TaxID=1798460 RepID=A0A1G2A6R9_9BACT|nr:MAG: 3-isopropylmalate dehydrogenase [Parcubacteria group bacterium GW2011_GWC2_44_17]OGY72222.1 MAG: 3-isopropylmalate dehydrogenase [Candidatus Jacksonbacteria bacterium RIFCSPHIGHO2_12_FULL_44_12]OGY72593.1 MAG: 3-isopropylmalate dehydrogenase [Candidatus Jacksonbacteria bacterium RIFCSPLOWO2_02_FULL_44_20]OGY73879.1 MAG: 3-isopropylmalate dehydrogenase [Candidatus Jacksonbacteria bacterium RIFCSPLOWO2_12_FULL_44_15b]OGY76572.1 MAG: 3-isopropylmalate dehydrogenase [Candidatus Jacksonbacte
MNTNKIYTIAVIPGDGIGKEVMPEALKTLRAVSDKFGYNFAYNELLVGKDAYEKHGEYLPQSVIAECKSSDAILLGATGVSVETGRELILTIREEFKFFSNLRPVVSLMKGDQQFDFLIVRELAGGIYFGKREEADYRGLSENVFAKDGCAYSVSEITRIARVAFSLAQKRRKHVTSVDKANVLATSRLWRKVVDDVAKEFQDVSHAHMFIDNAAMQIIKNPAQFDVLLTDNLFGDILSDEAAGIVGSLGLMPSSSMNEFGFALYEPVHGSAPDIAGKGVANPIGMILSSVMMLRHSFNLEAGASLIEESARSVIMDGYGTLDMMPAKIVGTEEIGDMIAQKIFNIS